MNLDVAAHRDVAESREYARRMALHLVLDNDFSNNYLLHPTINIDGLKQSMVEAVTTRKVVSITYTLKGQLEEQTLYVVPANLASWTIAELSPQAELGVS